MPELTLIDSPVANVANIARALRAAGASLEVTSDPEAIGKARKLVLPGVGSFIAAMNWVTEHRIDSAIRAAVGNGSSLLGICVGHQLLFDASLEMGTTAGLGLLRGEVQPLRGALPVPQIGWNRVTARGPLFEGVENDVFYFVNSYAVMDAPVADDTDRRLHFLKTRLRVGTRKMPSGICAPASGFCSATVVVPP